MSWILTIPFFFAFIIFIGFVLRGIDRVWRGASAESGTAMHDGILPAALAINGLSEDERPQDDGSLFSEDDDLLTNPVYSHLPGNIHHSIDDIGTGIDTGPDYINDPVYSFMPMNIFYDDDTQFDSGSSFDDCTSLSSSFDDDWSSSTSSFDDWSSGSSFDDW